MTFSHAFAASSSSPVLLGDLGETFLDFCCALLLLGGEIGTGFAEVGHRFGYVALFRSRELLHGLAATKGFEGFPELLIGGMAAKNADTCGSIFEGLTQLRAMHTESRWLTAPCTVERLESLIEGRNGVRVVSSLSVSLSRRRNQPQLVLASACECPVRWPLAQ